MHQSIVGRCAITSETPVLYNKKSGMLLPVTVNYFGTGDSFYKLTNSIKCLELFRYM